MYKGITFFLVLIFLVMVQWLYAEDPEVEFISIHTNGETNVVYKFVFRVKTSKNKLVSIRIDWGDGKIDGWSEFYPSGTKITTKHS